MIYLSQEELAIRKHTKSSSKCHYIEITFNEGEEVYWDYIPANNEEEVLADTVWNWEDCHKIEVKGISNK